ncbi:MAG TPA: transporter substrate-binding domain-containing protein [Burkholderiaceae bacterium]
MILLDLFFAMAVRCEVPPKIMRVSRMMVLALRARVKRGFLLACLLPALLLQAAPARAENRILVYPRAEGIGDRRDDYPVDLLTLALSKAGRHEQLQASAFFMLQARSIRELEQGRAMDVIWTMTSIEREESMLPIRIPIDRGLLGWRLLMVRQDSLARFAHLRRLTDLQDLRAGQGADWPDTSILRKAGLTVDESAHYGDLFLKLAAGRIDYFPRGVNEIWGELQSHTEAGLAVDPRLALHYPTAMYFFVNKRDAALAADITRGLEKALRDGSFEALFQRYFGASIQRANLGERQILELKNPLLPPETPLGEARLWYHP